MRPQPSAVCVLVSALVMLAPGIRADQSTPAPAAPSNSWQLSAGYDTFALRDAARTGQPVDGSPTRWVGSGPMMVVEYERARTDRLHRAEAIFSSDGSFDYDTSISRVARPSSESVRQLTARYEYIRYPRRFMAKGLSFGIGVAGGGERWSISRDAASVAMHENGASADIASILAVRTRYSERWDIQASWLNAMRLLNVGLEHPGNPDGGHDSWGGGWSTEWSASAGLRIAAHARLRVAYTGIGYGNLSSHHHYTVEGRRLAMGVSYVR